MSENYNEIIDILFYTDLMISDDISYNLENISYIIEKLSKLKQNIIHEIINYNDTKSNNNKRHDEISNNSLILEKIINYILNNNEYKDERFLLFFKEKFIEIVELLTF